ncbi:archaeosortase A, partial [Halobacteriales archaeon SW_7_68_16]
MPVPDHDPAVSTVTDALAWTVVGVFVAAAALDAVDRRDDARLVASGAWMLFGGFWLAVFPIFAFEMRSFIEGGLALIAVPACVYTGYLLHSGRLSLLVLSRAVAFMGVLYLPVETVPIVRRVLIESVAGQTHAVATALGYDVTLTTGPTYGYRSRFIFETNGAEYSTYIITACTGIGSMAIFGGLIAAVDARIGRKLRAFALAVGIIWTLNIARNVFIAVAFGRQWFQHEPLVAIATGVVGYQESFMTSFFIADRVISQTLAVVALVGITWVVVQRLPELLAPL